jgi:hypothetical protein
MSVNPEEGEQLERKSYRRDGKDRGLKGVVRKINLIRIKGQDALRTHNTEIRNKYSIPRKEFAWPQSQFPHSYI